MRDLNTTGRLLGIHPGPPLWFHDAPYQALADYSAISSESEEAFARRLTTEHGVAAIPTSAFYDRPEERGIVRFCFGKKDETLDRALERLCRL